MRIIIAVAIAMTMAMMMVISDGDGDGDVVITWMAWTWPVLFTGMRLQSKKSLLPITNDAKNHPKYVGTPPGVVAPTLKITPYPVSQTAPDSVQCMVKWKPVGFWGIGSWLFTLFTSFLEWVSSVFNLPSCLRLPYNWVEQDPISGFFTLVLSLSSYDCKPYMTQLVRQFTERVFM